MTTIINPDISYVGIVSKIEAGNYVAMAYGPSGTSPIGMFHFRSVPAAKGWAVSFTDLATPVGERTEVRLGPSNTLKNAERLAESAVRNLPADFERRRAAALEGARPVVIKTRAQIANEKMRKIEALARELGLNVTHSARTETEGFRAGQIITSVIVEVVSDPSI